MQQLHHLQLWVTLSERYLSSKGVDWPKAERFCFNEWSNPDDDELGLQIVRVSDDSLEITVIFNQLQNSIIMTGKIYRTILVFGHDLRAHYL